MEKRFVQVESNIHIDWSGNRAPVYRLYVNDELFTERVWRWRNCSLDELIQIEAVPGKYRIKYELVQPHNACISVTEMKIVQGPGKIKGDNMLRIL